MLVDESFSSTDMHSTVPVFPLPSCCTSVTKRSSRKVLQAGFSNNFSHGKGFSVFLFDIRLASEGLLKCL